MARQQGLFWIEGNPGAGKSFLMKYAFDMMRKRNTGELIVSFFFHGRGTSLQKTPLGLFRALLSTFLAHFPGTLSRVLVTFQQREKRFGPHAGNRWEWTEAELQKIMDEVLIQETNERPVVIFIDALDECGKDAATALLTYFKILMEEIVERGGQVKLCLSSRHYPVLSVGSVPKVIVEERNDKDIRSVIQKQLKHIESEEKRRQFEKEILMKVQGGFQWAVLVASMVIDDDATGMNFEKLLDKIQAVSQALENLYGDILSGVNESEKPQTTRLLLWVLFAERPLSTQELRDALVTDKDMVHETVTEAQKP